MKKLKSFASLVLIGCSTARLASALVAPVVPAYGPATFVLKTYTLSTNTVTSTTNKTAISTNVTTKVVSKVATSPLLNKQILKLLVNSLTLPSSAVTNGHLVVDTYLNFFVTTPTSTNFAGSALSVNTHDGVVNGIETKTVKNSSTLVSETEAATATQVATLTYDDTQLSTADGKHTVMNFQGLLKTTYGDATTTFSQSFILTGQGDGNLGGTPVVVTGTVSGHVTGKRDSDDLQWASSVIGYSSAYGANPADGWSASQTLGQPNTYPHYGDIGTSWATSHEDDSNEYLELGFDAPAPIGSVSIYETYNPGAVSKVLIRNADTSEWVEVWSGPAAAARAQARIFTIRFPQTSFPVDAVRIELDSEAVPGWNEIDAVGIN